VCEGPGAGSALRSAESVAEPNVNRLQRPQEHCRLPKSTC
jgi:hypothetical protein